MLSPYSPPCSYDTHPSTPNAILCCNLCIGLNILVVQNKRSASTALHTTLAELLQGYLCGVRQTCSGNSFYEKARDAGYIDSIPCIDGRQPAACINNQVLSQQLPQKSGSSVLLFFFFLLERKKNLQITSKNFRINLSEMQWEGTSKERNYRKWFLPKEVTALCRK